MTKRKQITVAIGSLKGEMAAFRRAWKRAEAGEPIEEPRYHLSFESAPAMLKALSPKRWVLLEILRREGALSVAALARRLDRDYKNVHADVKALMEFGLIESGPKGLVVPFDIIRAELKLVA